MCKRIKKFRASLQLRWQRSPFIFDSVFAINIVERKQVCVNRDSFICPSLFPPIVFLFCYDSGKLIHNHAHLSCYLYVFLKNIIPWRNLHETVFATSIKSGSHWLIAIRETIVHDLYHRELLGKKDLQNLTLLRTYEGRNNNCTLPCLCQNGFFLLLKKCSICPMADKRKLPLCRQQFLISNKIQNWLWQGIGEG